MIAHSEATFWFVLPSLPMFLLIPFLMRSGFSFWLALAAGCAFTIALYSLTLAVGPKVGLRLRCMTERQTLRYRSLSDVRG